MKRPILMLKVFLFLRLTFPLAAQEMIETPGGLSQRTPLNQGGTFVCQRLADRPVVAISLVQPWGRADDPPGRPGLVDFLGRLVSRSSPSYPGGALLVELNRIGGRQSYQCGEHWTSWTLVVPRAYGPWALQAQLERAQGPDLKLEDIDGLGHAWGVPGEIGSIELQSFSLQHWDSSRAVIAASGGLGNVDKVLASSSPSRQLSAPVAAGPRLAIVPGQLRWHYPRPKTSRAQAALHFWQLQLAQDFPELEVELDPASQHIVLCLDCPSETLLEEKRRVLKQAARPLGAGQLVTGRTRALRDWLQSWDDLAERSRKMALLQAQGQLEQSLAVYEELLAYQPQNWNTDLNWLSLTTPLEAPYAAKVAALKARKAASEPNSGKARRVPALPQKTSAAPAPPFVRWEYAPNCGALVQQVPDLPLVAVRAVVPGGAAWDTAAEHGRAEQLAACWQGNFAPRWQTRVDTNPNHWIFSAYLPTSEATPWVQDFLRILQDKPASLAATAAGPASKHPLQPAYDKWISLLFPAEHPLGRQSQAQTTPSLQRLQDLASEVRRRGRWQLFLSGDITASEVEAAVYQVNPPKPDNSLAIPGDALPTQEQPPTEGAWLEVATQLKACSLLVGGLGPSRREADYYAFVLLLERLAGDPLEARLPLEIRHKQRLAQRLDCSFLSSTSSSPWLVRIDCEASQVEAIGKVLEEQLKELRTKAMTEGELEQAVTRLEGLQQLANSNATGRVLQLRNLELFRLADSYNQGFAGIYRNIRPADVLRCAQRRLAPAQIVRVLARP